MKRRFLGGSAVIATALAVLGIWLLRRNGAPVSTPTISTLGDRISPRVSRGQTKFAVVAGRVVRKSDHAPLANAVVTIARRMPAGFPGENEAAIVVTSDLSGQWSAPDVPTGDYYFAATANGFVPAVAGPLEIGVGEQHPEIEIALEGGGTVVSGTVSDRGGGPVGGARVIAREDRGGPAIAAITGADGRYQLGLSPGAYQLEAVHDEYASAWRNVELVADPQTADFALAPGGIIHGRVIARDTKQPVPDALIDGLGVTLGRADSDGNFTLRRLSAMEFWLEARAHGYATKTATRVPVAAGEQVNNVELVVEHAFNVKGKVVSSGDPSRAISGAKVDAAAGNGFVAAGDTDQDGGFEIPGLAPGRYVLAASKAGLLHTMGTHVEVVDKDLDNVTIEMSAGATISGRVEPAAIAKIGVLVDSERSVSNSGAEINALSARTQSDSTGAFTLRGVPDGSLQITAAAKDGRAGSISIVVAANDQSGLVLPITPRASVSGRVMDANGKPVAGVYVHAMQLDVRRSFITPTDGNFPLSKSAADGTFRVQGLALGHYSVYVDSKRKVDVDLSAAGERTGIVLVSDARDGVIRGKVVDNAGQPVADAWVAAASRSGLARRVRSDVNGQFALNELRTDRYTVFADDPRGEANATKSDVQPGDEVTLVLAAAGTLVVSVAQDGAPATKASIMCIGSVPGRGGEATDVGGPYTFERLPAGDYECSAEADGGTAREKVTVPSGGTARLDIELSRWASLSGVAVSAISGDPISGILVAAKGSSGSSDAAGRFVLDRVAAGSDTVMFSPRDQMTYGAELHKYSAKPGERVDLGTIKILAPRAGAEGTYGFSTDVRGNALVVVSLKADGPAAEAGIKLNDEIASIDGRSVGELGLQFAKRLLASGNVAVGQTTSIGLTRDAAVTVVAVAWK